MIREAALGRCGSTGKSLPVPGVFLMRYGAAMLTQNPLAAFAATNAP
jgi:hypothetical protein